MTPRRGLIFTLLAGALVSGAWADAWDEARSTAAVIDRMIGEAQTEAGLAPSPLADDAEFLRRVTIDLTGRIPERDLAERFLEGQRPERRQLLIDHLMQTSEYRDGWALQWTLWLFGRERGESRVDRLSFRDWVRDDVIAANMPHDEFVRELLTATGRTDENGAANYLAQFARAPENAAGLVARHFVGQQIQCAQCHDHKYEDFTQEQFWNMVAFFENTRARPIREDGRFVAASLVEVPARARGRGRNRATTIQDTDTVVDPVYLDGTVYDRREVRNLRVALAEEITDPADPAFARATVNRLWAHFFGRGFVEPIDDFRETNTGHLPELLDHLAEDFTAHGFDREHLIRSIVSSQTYQRSSAPTGANAHDAQLYTHARLRALTPEQLFNSLTTMTGFDPRSQTGRRRSQVMPAGRSVSPAQRAERILSQFIFTHSDDEMNETTVFEGTIPLTLFMMNSTQLNRALSARRAGTLATIMSESSVSHERVTQLYLAALSRHPTPEEMTVATSHLQMPRMAGITDQTQLENLAWALMNTSEFLFNH